VSREELHNDLVEGAKTTKIYISMIILSSIVAAIGVLNDNVAVIIGAMVIAPLLTPNVSLSLATTLGDLPLFKSALKTLFLGIAIVIILSAAIGFLLHVDPSLQEISSRTHVGLTEIVLALASGAAGALSFTSYAPAVLIGVAVAVALMPPLVVFGLLLGAGNYSLAFGALSLFLANLISIQPSWSCNLPSSGNRAQKHGGRQRRQREPLLLASRGLGVIIGNINIYYIIIPTMIISNSFVHHPHHTACQHHRPVEVPTRPGGVHEDLVHQHWRAVGLGAT